MGKIKHAKALCRIFGDGQKVIAAVMEMEETIRQEQVVETDFQVTGRNVRKVYVSQSGELGEAAPSGTYLILELDEKDPEAGTKYRIGKGRDARTGIRRPVLNICYLPQKEQIETSEVVDQEADRFRLFRYPLPESDKYLDYQLYVPEKMEEGDRYPLVLFMHDMGACSDDKLAPLAQGTGAVVWTKPSQQKERPCFVVAPCYPNKCANDEYQVTWEADATVSLVKELCRQYPIDENRIYGTGQSMGCMMLCELNLRYPEMFAGSYLVAGQWDPERMKAVKDQNLWILVSQKDIKAFPIMGECMKRVEEAGGTVVRGSIHAKAPLEEQNAEFRRLAGEDAHIFFTWYEGDSVLPEGGEDFPGAYHINTWVHAYNLESVREWLFRQRK